MDVRKTICVLVTFAMAGPGWAAAEAVQAVGAPSPPENAAQDDPVRDTLVAACINGRGAGTALLAISERIESCSALSARAGDAYTGLFHRARARQSIQDWSGAEADFTAALRQEPDAADALFERGRVRFLYLDAPDLALADFDLAAALSPERAQIHMMHALTAIDLARDSREGAQVGALIDTAKTALTTYLALTEGTQDIAEQLQRDAAKDVLGRLVQN